MVKPDGLSQRAALENALTADPAPFCIGLMTGTALDGAVDAALIRTDGTRIEELGAFGLFPYGDDMRDLFARAIAAARQWDFEGPEPEILAQAERALTQVHAHAVHALLRQTGLGHDEIKLIGLHGLTVLHRPKRADSKPGFVGRTRQLGDGPLLASLTGIPVAFDFRSADVANGGQGAPLAPIYHRALLGYSQLSGPHVVVNLGGVANITFWDGADDLLAFDTGPANGPLNEWVEALGLGTFDRDGALAAAGEIDRSRLRDWLQDPFFAAPYPKSLDRYDFSASRAQGLSPADGAATLTAFTAAALAHALNQLPARPQKLILCGGGRKNPVLVSQIVHYCGLPIVDSDALGWRGDAIEAEAFAFLAARSVQNLPISFPRTTAITRAQSGGRLAWPAAGR